MEQIIKQIDFNSVGIALYETLYMSCISLFFAVIFGLILGIIIYGTQKNGLFENEWTFKILNTIVNIFRAIPFIILLIILVPITKILVGTMLGVNASLPSLIVSATPFFARMTMIALTEVDKGTIEASRSMGASRIQIILKVLLPESMPALISAIAVTGINLIGYTAMAGAIGSGGLGNLAYLYGLARNNLPMTYMATIIIVMIVFIVQGVGDYLGNKIDKR